MRLRLCVLALLTAGLAVGCANFATFQEADVIPKSEKKFGVGATYTSYVLETTDEMGVEEQETVAVPALNFWFRYGVADKLELHAHAWVPLGASIGGKYQLLGESKQPGLALSLGLDVGALQVTAGETTSGEDTASLTIIDIYVPVYLGYRTSPGFAAYLVPKYIHRQFIGRAEGDTASATEEIAGSTFGIAIGEKNTFMIEASFLRDLTLKANFAQAGIGIAF